MRSYSQHEEDVYLWNYIKKHKLDIPKTFIELGACDGTNLSNCRLFAEQGWSGICVEANPNYYKDLFLLYKDRPDVECLNAAVIPEHMEGTHVEFNIYPDFIDHSGIHHYEKHSPCVKMEIETVKYKHLNLDKVGLLSIDIEGMDTFILTDVLLSDLKPEFIIIESNTLEERRHQVDLLNIDYDIINILDVNTIWKRREQ